MKPAQIKISAVYMRGGTSKGMFFHRHDLPSDPALRDKTLLRLMGSPDPYAKQIDGMGGATSSTSKVVIINPSERCDCDIDYLCGHVSINHPLIDYSGNCGNLTAAAAHFAVEEGLTTQPNWQVDEPYDVTVNIWQSNTQKKIIATVPCLNGLPYVNGSYSVAGVGFSGTKMELSFLEPAGAGTQGGVLPLNEEITILSMGNEQIEVSLIDAGNPTIFVRAADLGLAGTEEPSALNHRVDFLQRLETIRAHASVLMGLANDLEQATFDRPATPKIAFVAPPRKYITSDNREIQADEVDILARILSMGKLHHGFTGTGAISLAAAANIEGTVVHQMLVNSMQKIRIGHVAGIMDVSAQVSKQNNQWTVDSVTMNRSARRLMEGQVLVPNAE
ncbi:PrpF domain-containing protein [Candidatus Albibeggiatoa sp. nov. NOAA]|uniref:2-methylaconitate cis-trans isomerase PrpF family protein n=1 Tax=Candidatus Albibeggiatoa sp. nov. NOAA TaxID=3162724 RepID=UPI0032F5D30F|nr:putative methylaconitate Delta-isomerase PrpF [Thiotrichaceae bacterium]